MKRKFNFLTPWKQFTVRKKYRQIIIYLISVMSVFLIISLYFLHLSGAYDYVSNRIYNFFGISEFTSEAKNYPVSVHFIDVGNGDAVLIHTDNVNIMIDSGEYTLNGTATQYLNHFGVENIDLFIATHNDSDHIGDFSHIADKYKIRQLWINKYVSKSNNNRTEDEKIFYKIAKDKNIKTVSPEIGSYKIGDITLDVLSPDKEFSNDNDNSLVIKISYKDISMLFTGDAGKATEKYLLDKNADIKADILKVSHHGSKTASTEDFISAVCPKYAVISVGTKNKYLPDKNTVKTLEYYNIKTYRTDLDGSVIAVSDGKKISILKEKSA